MCASFSKRCIEGSATGGADAAGRENIPTRRIRNRERDDRAVLGSGFGRQGKVDPGRYSHINMFTAHVWYSNKTDVAV